MKLDLEPPREPTERLDLAVPLAVLRRMGPDALGHHRKRDAVRGDDLGLQLVARLRRPDALREAGHLLLDAVDRDRDVPAEPGANKVKKVFGRAPREVAPELALRPRR